MNTIKGVFFDGSISRKHEAQFSGAQRLVLVETDESTQRYAIDDVIVSSRLEDVQRSIRFPDGSQFVTSDNEAVDELLEALGQSSLPTIPHKLERFIPLVVISWFGLVLFGAWFYLYAIPKIVETAVAATPRHWEEQIRDQAMEQLWENEFVTTPEVDAAEQAMLDQLVAELMLITPANLEVKIDIVDSAIFGANALALPGDQILITKALIDLAENDNQIKAVYLHELGHIADQHALRMALQQSLLALSIVIVTGDVTAATDIAVTLPTLLLTMNYSREFEMQADDYAIKALRQHAIPIEAFANIMEILANQESTPGIFNSEYLSTHPMADDRIAKIRNNQN